MPGQQGALLFVRENVVLRLGFTVGFGAAVTLTGVKISTRVIGIGIHAEQRASPAPPDVISGFALVFSPVPPVGQGSAAI